jgi:hypothetical protein
MAKAEGGIRLVSFPDPAVMILLSIVLVLIPYLIRYAPEIQKLPLIVLYICRRNNFIFATSPILIAISII